jgi:hypothetical protein
MSEIENPRERRFHIFRSTLTGEYYFRLVAENNRTIAASEGYHNHSDVMDLHDRHFPDWKVDDESGGPTY